MSLHNELGLESFKFSRSFRKLFFKIKKYGLPEYLFKVISLSNHQYNTRKTENIATFSCRIGVFKYYYFPATIME